MNLNVVLLAQTNSLNLHTHYSFVLWLQVNGKYVIKSGTDFRNMSKITIEWSSSRLDITVDRVDLDSSVGQDPDVKKDVDRLFGKFLLSSLRV